jgi:hypothetical protein
VNTEQKSAWNDEVIDRAFCEQLHQAAALVAGREERSACDLISKTFASLANHKDRDVRVKALGVLAVEAMKAQRDHERSAADRKEWKEEVS